MISNIYSGPLEPQMCLTDENVGDILLHAYMHVGTVDFIIVPVMWGSLRLAPIIPMSSIFAVWIIPCVTVIYLLVWIKEITFVSSKGKVECTQIGPRYFRGYQGRKVTLLHWMQQSIFRRRWLMFGY